MASDPIFIGGMQRSGTSLMRAIVGSHPDVAIFEWDLPLWVKFFNRFKKRNLNRSEVLAELLNVIFTNDKVKQCDVVLDHNAVKQRISQAGHPVTCGVVFQCFLEEYAHQIGRPRWGLKTPHNEFFAEQIFAAYPNARMVQLIRDPRDVAISYKTCDGWASSYVPDEHIEKWKKSVEVSQINQERYGDRYLCVRYEDLVQDSEKIVKEVCQTLNLDFSPSLLEMNNHLGWTGSNSSFEDLGRQTQEISTSAIGRYRSLLEPQISYLYQSRLRKEMIQLNYELEHFNVLQHAQYYLKDLGTGLKSRVRTTFAD